MEHFSCEQYSVLYNIWWCDSLFLVYYFGFFLLVLGTESIRLSFWLFWISSSNKNQVTDWISLLSFDFWLPRQNQNIIFHFFFVRNFIWDLNYIYGTVLICIFPDLSRSCNQKKKRSPLSKFFRWPFLACKGVCVLVGQESKQRTNTRKSKSPKRKGTTHQASIQVLKEAERRNSKTSTFFFSFFSPHPGLAWGSRQNTCDLQQADSQLMQHKTSPQLSPSFLYLFAPCTTNFIKWIFYENVPQFCLNGAYLHTSAFLWCSCWDLASVDSFTGSPAQDIWSYFWNGWKVSATGATFSSSWPSPLMAYHSCLLAIHPLAWPVGLSTANMAQF